MAHKGGYVRLYRKLLEDPIWTQLGPAVLKVAIYFLLRANYERDQWYDGVETVEIPTGSFITSYAKAAADCGLSPQQVRDAFGHLERTQFATYQRTRRWTLVTVADCATSQGTEHGENTVKNGVETGKRTTDKERKKKTTDTSPYGDVSKTDSFIHGPPGAGSRRGPLNEGRKPSTAGRLLSPEQAAWFPEWWAIYLRRVAKEAARKAFAKQVNTEDVFRQVMAATRAQSAAMAATEERYRPHPATWLNAKRWEDETAESAPRRQTDSKYQVWQPEEEI